MMKQQILLFALTVLLSTSVYSQNQKQNQNKSQSTQFDFQRSIGLDKHTKLETIDITIAENTMHFDLKIETVVTSGKLTIEIYDSNDKNKGTFSVGTQLNTGYQEETLGNITKSLLEPEPGNWKVKIIPINASGVVNIRTSTLL